MSLILDQKLKYYPVKQHDSFLVSPPKGTNVVEAASKTRVKHLLYVGTPYNNKFASVECRSLIGRERVEQLVIKCGRSRS